MVFSSLGRVKSRCLAYQPNGRLSVHARQELGDRLFVGVAKTGGHAIHDRGTVPAGTRDWRDRGGALAPEANLMGGIGLVALLVNVVAAFVLSRFREGDANMRAVWLFSRNDALGNVAVIVAAGLVAWTGSAWPDLTVAVLIAGIFLHSAYEILRGARSELRELAQNDKPVRGVDA